MVLNTFDYNRIFNYLEVEMQDRRTRVRSPLVLFTDRAGNIEIIRQIGERLRHAKTKQRLWSSHVVYYLLEKVMGFRSQTSV